MVAKDESAVAHLVEGGKDQAHKAVIKHLVWCLCLDVNMGGQDGDVWV